MPKREMPMLRGVENCWRMELAERVLAASRYVGSGSATSTPPEKSGQDARK